MCLVCFSAKLFLLHIDDVSLQGNAYDDDEEYGDVDDGGDEGATY